MTAPGPDVMPWRRLPEQEYSGIWARLSDFVADKTGLHFPRERLTDLQRGIAAAAEEFGFDDAAACADWLLCAPVTKTQLQVLASHLTVGETYFFRDPRSFEILTTTVLPELIRSRRGREQRLRLWSAACCSGEEAYSLAILLHQLLPDIDEWQITILATDINTRFLKKAIAGTYSDWSFRGAQAGAKARYFTRTANGRFAIRPEVRKLVTFEHLNLVEDVYPSLATDTNAMDIIFCRNVLMYFTREQTRRVIGKLHHSLVEGGWLAVSPSEASQALFPQFVTVTFPGAILYRKDGTTRQTHSPSPPPAVREFTPPAPSAAAAATRRRSPAAPAPMALALSLYEEGRYSEAVDTLLAGLGDRTPEPAAFSLLTRALANQGRLAEALTWCDRWIAADKLNAAAYYLRAVVLLERGGHDDARRSLQSAVYLDAGFVLAHFALGNLARSRGRHEEADRHFANTLRLLGRLEAHDLLPESDGLTAGRLTETINTTAAAVQRP